MPLYIKQSNNRRYLINIIKEKKAVFLSVPNDMSIKEKLCNEMNVKVNFYEEAKLTKINNNYYEGNEENYISIILPKVKVIP